MAIGTHRGARQIVVGGLSFHFPGSGLLAAPVHGEASRPPQSKYGTAGAVPIGLPCFPTQLVRERNESAGPLLRTTYGVHNKENGCDLTFQRFYLTS